ncbi:hypothetical protein VTH06DRAFT_6900 [Thermothelomyces fergusii]
MASIARCLRVARPAAFSAAVRSSASRSVAARAFSVTASNALRKYTKDHEWIDISADKKTGVVGISNYAAGELGDIVYVELPEVGMELKAGDVLGSVESVKSAGDINAPVSCKVTEVNRSLEDTPGTVSRVPEDDSQGGGWIAKVELTEDSLKEFEELLDDAEYKKFTAEEGHH